MSSFPQFTKNIEELKKMGFDISDFTGDLYESWGYDEQVYLMTEIIGQLNLVNFRMYNNGRKKLNKDK